MDGSIAIGGLVLIVILIGLAILFVISLVMFTRRSVRNSTVNANSNLEINEKLDRIIELLEKEKGK